MVQTKEEEKIKAQSKTLKKQIIRQNEINRIEVVLTKINQDYYQRAFDECSNAVKMEREGERQI